MGFSPDAVERYLKDHFGEEVRVISLHDLKGKSPLAVEDLKVFGYGSPIQIDVAVGGVPRSLVLMTLREGRFGHEHFADRAQNLLWSHGTYRRLPRHVASLDVGFVTEEERLCSAGRAVEFFLLTDRVEGAPYRNDLERIRQTGTLLEEDRDRAIALARYLRTIHATTREDEGLALRRIRDLVGHGEGIMGILDSYPPDDPLLPHAGQAALEERVVRWRYRLKGEAGRLSLVHGDFHPWNILFREGVEFTLLDRSRGEWGFPADDVAALTINYLFFSLLRSGSIAGPFADLFRIFFDAYVEDGGDATLLRTLPIQYLFRALVLASPVWYPRLPETVRRALVWFVWAMAEAEAFDPAAILRYFGEGG